MSTDTPQPPRAVQPQPAREVVAGQRLYIDLTEHIEDPNGEPLTFKLRNSLTPDIATATLAGSTLTVTGVAPGAATFRIGATDDVDPGPRINEFILELHVTVTPVPLLPPRAVHPQPVREVVAGQRLYIDLTEHIEDPNGEPLTFKLRNSLTPEIATATLVGNILTVTGVAPGEATFRIGATDDVDPGPRINEFILELRVTVTDETPPPPPPPRPREDPYAPDTATITLTVTQTSAETSAETGSPPAADETGSRPSPPPQEELKVYRVRGEEAISRLFRYEIDLVRIRVNVDDGSHEYQQLTSEEVLGRPATLEANIAEGDNTAMPRRVYGIIGEFRELTKSSLDGRHYRLVLVPRLAKLAYNRQSRIHATAATQTLDEIVSNKLSASGADYKPPTPPRYRATLKEFRTNIKNTELPRQALSHITQYNETDLDFLCRLCEHYGVYFFFDADVVVFGNTNALFRASESGLEMKLLEIGSTGMVGDSEYEPEEAGPLDDQGDPAIVTPAKAKGNLLLFEHVRRPSPRCVRVVDYNPDQPGKTLQGEYISQDSLEYGIHTDHDTHFLTEAEGNIFAKIRYRELHFANNYYVGATTSPCVAPGRLFQKLPPESQWAAGETWQTRTGQQFLVIHTTVEMAQAHMAPSGLALTDPDGEPVQTNFRSEFRCVFYADTPKSTPNPLVFCPPRLTPVPRLSGVYKAQVDTSTVGATRPDLDTGGAYRIAHTYDERQEVTQGKNSMPVCKAEPYAGEGGGGEGGEGNYAGMHFPLRQGTEVMVTYVNGDPDRPIIAGAIPNATHQSPVRDTNNVAHLIRTSSDSLFGIVDAHTPPAEDGSPDYQARLMLRAGKDHYLRLGHPDSDREKGYAEDFRSIAESATGIFTYSKDHINETARLDKNAVATNTYARSLESHILSGRRMVIHAGQNFTDATAADDATESGLNQKEMVILADNDALIKTGGNLYREIGGSVEDTILGSVEDTILGDDGKTTHGNTQSYLWGSKTSIIGGNENKVLMGLKTSLVMGGDAKVHMSLAGKLHLGFAATIQLGGFAKIAGPLVASIGYGVKMDKKAEVHGNFYTLKIEKIGLAEMKSVLMEFKKSGIKLEQDDLEVQTTHVTMKSAATRMIQGMLHLTM